MAGAHQEQPRPAAPLVRPPISPNYRLAGRKRRRPSRGRKKGKAEGKNKDAKLAHLSPSRAGRLSAASKRPGDRASS